MLVVLQALDAAGKDGTIRHVMSGVNPQGVVGPQLQGPVGRGARPRLPLAVRASSSPRAARSASSTARTTRRCSWSGCTPSSSRRQRLPGPPKHGKPTDLEAPVPRDQRLGALPRRQRLPHREAVPQPLEGGAARALPRANRRAGEELEVLGRRRRTSASTGTTTRWRSPRCSRTRAPSGRRGT